MRSVHTPAYRELLARLIAAREARGMTQTVVAQRLGMPQSRVSRIESGERRLDVIELLDFVGLYRVSVATLLRGLAEDRTTS